MSRAPIQLEYATYQRDPARRSKLASIAIASCIVFLSIGGPAFTTAAMLGAVHHLPDWGEVLFLAVYGAGFALLAVLWSLGRTRALLIWNSLVLVVALVLSVIAWAH